MHIVISGAGGLIGSSLAERLTAKGHRISRLTRAATASPGMIRWDPTAGTIDAASLNGVEVVVHLAGESIMGGWTPAKKAAIRDSRVRGTRLLSTTLADLPRRPHTLICASAVGYYGSRGDEILTEESEPGHGFMAEVGRAWELAAEPAVLGGIRVAHLRFGVVLSMAGGALKHMTPPFRLGLGGRMGTGQQYWSWVTLADVIGSIEHVLTRTSLRGPFNVVAPQPIANRDFAQALGRALLRPACLPMPTFAVRALFGELGDAVFLSSQRVLPNRLLASGYQFQHPTLDGALTALLRPATTTGGVR